MDPFSPAVFETGRSFVFSPLSYVFSAEETRALRPFFTNLNRRAFFMHALPANVGASLLAMFSRLKNPRGLRGVWVDSFLPLFFATQLPEVEQVYGGSEERYLRENGLTTLDAFLAFSSRTRELFTEFLDRGAIDPGYLQDFSAAKKTRKMLDMYLDKYGHNSIARMGTVWIGFEGISLLAAKSIEWTRPGSGYIELSTRYVDMSARPRYPAEEELTTGWGVDPTLIRDVCDYSFHLYQELAGNNFDGPFPSFLRERYGQLYADAPKDLESGVIGETCDVLGNLLPAATLTSVGVAVSGEAFPQLLKHLLLDATPENHALVSLVLEEAEKVGAQQFARHYQPTPWERAHWTYLDPLHFVFIPGTGRSWATALDDPDALRQLAERTMGALLQFRDGTSRRDGDLGARLAAAAAGAPRGEHDKLPAEFESVSVTVRGLMSFRGWRDLHRQGFCTHFRSLFAPPFGFYEYEKPAPPALAEAFASLREQNLDLALLLREKNVPPLLAQYPLALGNRIGFVASANLRQWEFCIWQRTDFSVNHEVRQVFLDVHRELCRIFPWWKDVCRADTTPAYVFARGKQGIPLDP